MLEQVYLFAGIVGAGATIVGVAVTVFKLFFKQKTGTSINQNAKVSGEGNTVNQRLDSNIDMDDGD